MPGCSIVWLLAFVMPVFTGCGGGKDKGSKGDKAEESWQSPSDEVGGKAARKAGDDGGAPEKAENKVKTQKPRKIRTTANMHLIVEDFPEAVKDLKAVMKQYDGEEENVEINSTSNRVRSGIWKIRVPVAKFDDFREAVAKIGDVEKHTVNAEDLSDKFYDLLADIENLKAGRETLRDLLKETGKKEMKHYLEVWDKLENISGEINRKEGTLKLWENQTERTTCTVNLREKQPYIQASTVEDKEVPSFSQRTGKTWNDTWAAFVDFWQWVVICVIAVTPWLPVIVLAFVCLWLALRAPRRSHAPRR